MSTHKVGIIIPAFNEDEYLSRVLDVVCTAGWVDQIVLVDDGSTDNTLAVAIEYLQKDSRLVVLDQDMNRGKARAMLDGVQALDSDVDIVMFLDADLIGLELHHLELLYHPVRAWQSHMTVALFQHGYWVTDWAHRLTPNLSGQRCFRRKAAERMLAPLVDSGYGVEIGLTFFARYQKWRIQYIVWEGVTHSMKEIKSGYWHGLKVRSVMYYQVLSTYFKTWWLTRWNERSGFKEVNT
jgi:glycosyltransferase involved in cell wall biosynthesis